MSNVARTSFALPGDAREQLQLIQEMGLLRQGPLKQACYEYVANTAAV